MPVTIKSESFDGVTAPAIPSGWTVDAGVVTSTTLKSNGTNSLRIGTGTNAFNAHWGGATDGNSGDMQVSAWFIADTTAGSCQLFGRLTPPVVSGTGYSAALIWGGTGVQILKRIAGSPTALSTVAVTLAANVGYNVRLKCEGTTISMQVQRDSDSLWLTPAGTWDASQQDVISITDSSVTGAGYAGYRCNATAVNIYTDKFLFESLASSSGAVFSVTNSAMFYSPAGFRLEGTSYLEAIQSGNCIKGKFTGTSLTANLDTSHITVVSGYYPRISYSVDNGQFTIVQLVAAQTTQVLATGLSAGTHSFEFYYEYGYEQGELYGTVTNSVRVTGFTADPAATFSAATLRSKRMIAWGDSITHAAFDANPGSLDADSTQTAAHAVALALDAELSVIGNSGQGWSKAASNTSIGSFVTVWNKWDTGHTQTFSPEPDYIMISHGTNDTSLVSSTITTWIGSARTAMPNARIFIVVPFNGANRSTITTGVNNYISANPGDIKVHLIDLNTDAFFSTTAGAATIYSKDGIHPWKYAHGRLGAALANRIGQIITKVNSVAPSRQIIKGM